MESKKKEKVGESDSFC